MTAIGLRTLQQVGPDALAASPATPSPRVCSRGERLIRCGQIDGGQEGRACSASCLERANSWTVTFDERLPEARFPLIESQHLTTAAALDRRQYRDRGLALLGGPDSGAVPIVLVRDLLGRGARAGLRCCLRWIRRNGRSSPSAALPSTRATRPSGWRARRRRSDRCRSSFRRGTAWWAASGVRRNATRFRAIDVPGYGGE